MAPLIAQLEWLPGHWVVLVPLVLGFAGIWWLMPRARPYPRGVGAMLAGAALVAAGLTLFNPGERLVHDVLFHLFTGAALVAAVLMITSRNPVYAALWFAVVTLSTCGLFLLRSAPFLAAATVIVYAGAIIVTFLFLIMLAQQRLGGAVYDARSRQPLAATLLAFLVLGGLLCALRSWEPVSASAGQSGVAGTVMLPVPQTLAARPLTQRGQQPVGTVRGLGRTLFGDYLYAVELAGTLLMVASVGAIAIALRRPGRSS